MYRYVPHLSIRVCALGLVACATAHANPAILHAPDWKITFPVAGPKGTALEVRNPEFAACLQDHCTFPDSLNTYFYQTGEGLVFHTEYTGVTTSSNTKYSRTELREMRGSEEANWTLPETGLLEARLKIAALEGGADKTIFMQIHGKAPESQPLLKCIWEKGSIRLLTKSGPKLKDLSRKQRYVGIGTNEWFTCAIKVNRDALEIRINENLVETFGRDVLDCWPEGNTYYFKAGNYLQNNTPGAKATVVFSSIAVSHAGTGQKP